MPISELQRSQRDQVLFEWRFDEETDNLWAFLFFNHRNDYIPDNPTPEAKTYMLGISVDLHINMPDMEQ